MESPGRHLSCLTLFPGFGSDAQRVSLYLRIGLGLGERYAPPVTLRDPSMLGGGDWSLTHPNPPCGMRNLCGVQNQPQEWERAALSLALRTSGADGSSWFLQ